MDHRVPPGGNNNQQQQQHLQEDSLPPGFRFHPTDEELITYYLTNKISDANFSGRAITDVDLNKCEPWDLPAKAKMGEKEWYFFNLRDRKYPTGIRTNRATNAGYWKTTGKDKEIFNSSSDSNNDQLVGMKKTLVFYKGRAPRGEKTNWVMHEYRNQSKTTFRTTKDEWVVCRVFQKSAAGKKYPTHQPRANPYSFETGQGILPSLMQPPESCHFPIGRNFVSNADLAELSRVLRGGSMGNLPIQTQFSYPSPSCFTISGLNLNLGSSSSSQQGFREMPSTSLYPPQTVDVSGDASSSVLTNQQGQVVGPEIGFGSVDMNSSNHNGGHNNTTNNNRFQQMEPCVDLDGYWPSY